MNWLDEALHDDPDPAESREWIESIKAVIDADGPERAHQLLQGMVEFTRRAGAQLPFSPTTEYINTIPAGQEAKAPGDHAMEWKIRSIIRWNAMAMVVRANRKPGDLGGHIASFASGATLYDVGFNHFWRAPSDDHPGDLLYIQGHSSPGIYARSYLEGRITEDQLDHFRMEVDGRGLSSYPHPWLMPEYWQTPTVSMGLGPIAAIYQARNWKYLEGRGLMPKTDRKVWCFVGDGETDEPESLGAISVAGREGLDNLVFVVNCNLQRLDGPVRGNGKIMQELESYFRGAGWNVIKVVWGREWDELLARDRDGVLVNAMNTTPDGQFQTYSVGDGAFIRDDFFGPDPRLGRLVGHLSDEQLTRLSRGGHDYRKVYAAFKAAREHTGQPTVILAQTIKGWTLGPDFEARNATHQMKKLTKAELKTFRDRLYLEIPDSELEGDLPPYYHPGPNSDEIQYMLERRSALGGFLPKRVVRAKPLPQPEDKTYAQLRKGSGNQEVATTMAFVRLLKDLMRDKRLAPRFVPIIPDEARTFGMDSFFPTAKIYSPHGQQYDPVDRELLLSYRESKTGQILHEGISEAGSMASTIAAGTSYATHGEHMIPIFIFYSMFGFQRIADQIWAFADQLGRGFLLGATAGRTTLNGEGLQHEDGHSLLLASTNPACVAYDAAWAYELTYIVADALRRMYGENSENIFYYLTIYNEPKRQPPEPQVDNLEEGILRGLYRYAEAPAAHNGDGEQPRAQILASGTSMHWAIGAQQMLADDWGVAADVWSATSWTELRRDAVSCDEWNLLHPDETPRTPYVSRVLDGARGPVVAVSDWMRAVPDSISRWVPGEYSSLGTDGFGRSDTRPALRRHYHVDAPSIVLAVLTELAARGEVKHEVLAEAIEKYSLLDERAVPTETVDPAEQQG
ncbi:MAG: pyruvate dehydrogenase (acetyl-transferring), homodimeric type [Mycobacteriales bacterium]